MRRDLLLALLIAAGGCANMTGAKDVRSDIEAQTVAVDAGFQENAARAGLGQIENALAEYIKAEKKIPNDLDDLVPKYLGAIPTLDVSICGRPTEEVQTYAADVLRDGRIDGTQIKGSGRWGYAHNADRVVIFVDCLRTSADGTLWYQVRGIY